MARRRRSGAGGAVSVLTFLLMLVGGLWGISVIMKQFDVYRDGVEEDEENDEDENLEKGGEGDGSGGSVGDGSLSDRNLFKDKQWTRNPVPWYTAADRVNDNTKMYLFGENGDEFKRYNKDTFMYEVGEDGLGPTLQMSTQAVIRSVGNISVTPIVTCPSSATRWKADQVEEGKREMDESFALAKKKVMKLKKTLKEVYVPKLGQGVASLTSDSEEPHLRVLSRYLQEKVDDFKKFVAKEIG